MRTPAENTVDPQIASELEQLEGEFGPDLVALRAEPDQQFAADLDARAAEGFPGSEGRIERLRSRFAGSGRRRVLLPALAGATTVILVATVVVASNQGGEGTAPVSHVDTTTPETSRLGEAATKPEAAAGAAATATGTATSNAPLAPVTGRRRQIERSAEMTLGTDPEHVQDVSGKVFDIVRRFDGIVLSSSVRDGSDGDAGASFQLLFPSPHLGDALGDLSGIAEVRSRNESTLDITKPFVSVREHLRDARAEAAGLLKQLAGADSQAERDSIEAQLRQVRSRIAHLRSASQRLQRRSDFSRLQLEITTSDSGAVLPGSGSGNWTVGDALHDAGKILATALAVLLVTLAVLAPLALLGALAWAAWRVAAHRAREGALS